MKPPKQTAETESGIGTASKGSPRWDFDPCRGITSFNGDRV